MAAETTHAIDNNGSVRELIDDWAVAVRSKDVERVMAHYTSDVVAFDVVNPLEYKGTDLVRERLTGWLSSFQGPMGFEINNLEVEAGDYLAFCYSLNRVIGTKRDGVKINMCWRATLCCRKIDGRWKIKHSHASVPFDLETGLASLDLEP
ncbi:MAG TPA: nuclear transport factor 2 family protein [Aridibacter sp.]|nr:nuclear transport factor 2 family protein [Aridibacter sp.]